MPDMDVYLKKAEARIAEFEAKIKELEAKSLEAKADARQALKQQVRDVREQVKHLLSEWRRLKNAEGDEVEVVRNSLEQSWEALKDLFEAD